MVGWHQSRGGAYAGPRRTGPETRALALPAKSRAGEEHEPRPHRLVLLTRPVLLATPVLLASSAAGRLLRGFADEGQEAGPPPRRKTQCFGGCKAGLSCDCEEGPPRITGYAASTPAAGAAPFLQEDGPQLLVHDGGRRLHLRRPLLRAGAGRGVHRASRPVRVLPSRREYLRVRRLLQQQGRQEGGLPRRAWLPVDWRLVRGRGGPPLALTCGPLGALRAFRVARGTRAALTATGASGG
ncbi:unnamed protein product [Prorocentrum cordatum]|uniref:Uncharacterized protein n=1 Tax=Prorocentrum cordatum TaxID=2364126 RepID=A0ABN9RDI7_9DINO|nr:unnamed protein product [Polarella glacialis]